MTRQRWFWPLADWGLRLGLAGVFFAAALLKLRDPAGFSLQVTSYDLFPELSNFVAVTVPSTEIVGSAALLVLPPVWRRAGTLMLMVMLLGFTFAVVWAWASGVQADCGCFGDNSPQIGPLPLLRNLGLLALGGAVLRVDRQRWRTA